MSSASTNLYFTTAAHLLTSGTQSEEHQLLEEAFENVRQRYPEKKLPANIIDQLAQASQPEGWLQVFDQLRLDNKTLRHHEKDELFSRAGQIVDMILGFKEFGKSAAKFNETLAAPIWGLVSAALTAFQNIVKTGKAIDVIRERLGDWLKWHAELHATGFKLSPYLRSVLLAFNEIVVEFSFDIAAEFHNSRESTFRAASNQLLDDIDTFTRKLLDAGKNVDNGVNLDIWSTVKGIKHSQAFATVPSTTSPPLGQATTIKARKYFFPLLSSCFFGREIILQRISDAYASNNSSDCPRVVLHGMGGVGKSQAALRYAESFKITPTGGTYASIFFIRSGEAGTLIQQYALLAEELGLISKACLAQDDKAQVISLVKRYLSELPNWLLIFDDVVSMNDINEYVPDNGNGHILFTTRSDILADMLVPEVKDMIEVKPMNPDSLGTGLVLKLAKVPHPVSTEDNAAARDIAFFADGLPLAIEQLVLLGDRFGTSWKQALTLVKQKLDKTRRNSTTSIDLELPVAALVATTTSLVQKQNPKAAELFKILVYLDTSFIPLEIFDNAKVHMNEYLQRRVTYDRGASPAPPGRSRAELQLALEEEKFNFFDYDPFSFDWIRRLLHRGKFNKKYLDTDLPRIDSPSDVEMQKLWQKSGKLIQALFDNPVNTSDAMNYLVHAGLVRKLDASKAFWIHDLFAEMERNLLAKDPLIDHVSTAHLAATMIYLKFPILELHLIYKGTDGSLKLLPHAIASHSHLADFKILNDTTIGPELSHLIASTIDAANLSREAPEERLKAIKYYRDAFEGYFAAWKRLQNAKGITLGQVMLSTFADYSWEAASGHAVCLHGKYYDRFGGSAPWRCISTVTKVGLLFIDAGNHTEGIRWLQIAARTTSQLFGKGHEDTLAAHNRLMSAYMDQENWPSAYEAACESFASFHHVEQPPPKYFRLVKRKKNASLGGSAVIWRGTEVASNVGICCLHIPGKEKEAIQTFETVLSEKQKLWGHVPGFCYPTMQRLAKAHGNAGHHAKKLFWCGTALDAALGDSPSTIRMLKDESIVEAIDLFNEARAEVGDLEPDLATSVQAWVIGSTMWEMQQCLSLFTDEDEVSDTDSLLKALKGLQFASQ